MPKLSKAALVVAALSLSVPVSGLVAAQAQDTAVTLTDSAMQTKVEIPTITAVNSSMDEAAIRDVLTGNFMSHAADLAHLNADSVSVPEVDVTTSVKVGDTTSETRAVYKDIVLDHVKDGVAESFSAGSLTSSVKDVTVALGNFKASSVDFGALLGFYGVVPADGAEFRQLYKDLTFDGGTVTSTAASCTIGKIAVPSASFKPMKTTLAQLMQASQLLAAAKDGTPPPEAVGTLVDFFGDLFSSMKSEPLTVDGLHCSGKNDTGEPFDIGFSGLTMDGYQPGIYPAISIKGMTLKGGDVGVVSLDSATFKATDLSGPIAVLGAEDPKNLNEAWFTQNGRKLVPAFGGLAFSGLKVDVPDPQTPNSRIQANVASFDLSLGDYLNGIPTKITSTTTGLDVPLSASDSDEDMRMLAALGITRVNLNYDLAAAWDKDSKTIKLDKLSVSGNDLGSIAIAAVIGNAGPELFDTDPNVEQTASMALTMKSLGFDVMDAGLGDKLVPLLAQDQGVPPDQFRVKMAGVAEGAALQLLGATDAARALAVALGDFISGRAKSLHIDTVAKDPNGIGMAEFMTAEDDPSVLAGAVDITGRAQ